MTESDDSFRRRPGADTLPPTAMMPEQAVCSFADAPFPAVTLMGQPVHALTEADAIAYILRRLDEHRGGWVATHNLDHLRRLTRDPAFAELCRKASLRTADGKPLLWAAKLQGTPLPERVAGSDLTWSLTAALAGAGRSVFLLGGNPPDVAGGRPTADVAADAMRQRYPGLKIAGTYCPPFGYDKNPAEMEAIAARVTEAKPDVVYVAVGSPKQERLIEFLLPHWPGAWYLGVGISLSFVTGEVRRAPVWMRRAGLEWVHRMAQEPGRLARRYLLEGIPFAARLMLSSGVKRVTRRG